MGQVNHRRLRLAAAVLLLIALAASPAAARAQAGHGPATARTALHRAEALIRPGHHAVPRDGTIALRDLALGEHALGRSGQQAAQQMLARPPDDTDPADVSSWPDGEDPSSPLCDTTICVHWAAPGADAPPATDTSPADGIPDWVATVLQTAEQVWNTEIDTLGYRPPLQDTTSADNGGDGRLDIYLNDLAPAGLYGACTSDDPKLPTLGQPGVTWDVSAWCEIDNDYADPIYAGHTPLENLRVTLAHELFNAVQFAYDFGEDAWLMQATATWMEDEVFTDVNANRQYLTTSPLSAPWVPLDHTRGCCYQNGAWIWFRYLSERLGPSIVRDIWERADAAAGGPDDYSTQAIVHALRADGTTFRQQFGDFAAANRIPALAYSEGQSYPAAPLAASYRLGATRPSTGWLGVPLKHMSSAYLMFRPGRSAGARAHLTVRFDGPGARSGPEARLIVFTSAGGVHVKTITTDRAGDGSLRVRFGRGNIARVVLVMTNASTRFTNCFPLTGATQYSCQGTPVDDGRRFSFRATAR